MCLAQGPQRSDAGEARTRGPSKQISTPINFLQKKYYYQKENLSKNGKNNSVTKIQTGIKYIPTACRQPKTFNFKISQYKCLMGIIHTDKFLIKCKIGETTLCNFCIIEIETIYNHFWEGIYVQHFLDKPDYVLVEV